MMNRLLQITLFLFLQDLNNCNSCVNHPCHLKEKTSGPLSTPSPTPIRAKCSPFTETECLEYIPGPDKFFDSPCRDLGGVEASVINETENYLLQQLMEIESVAEVWHFNKNQYFQCIHYYQVFLGGFRAHGEDEWSWTVWWWKLTDINAPPGGKLACDANCAIWWSTWCHLRTKFATIARYC